ncbi:MAG: chemotaxis protein CheW [Hydrogenoanaerobacterium sp.]
MQANNFNGADFKEDFVGSNTEMYGKYLTFWTDGQLFGVPIADVVQIVGIQEITVIPEFPDYAKGVINLRGNIIPLIDVRLRFHKQEAAYDERTCIIVTNICENSIGFIVDSVDAVTDIADDKISIPPKLAGDMGDSYLTGVARVESKVVLLLDTGKILSKDTMLELTSVEL